MFINTVICEMHKKHYKLSVKRPYDREARTLGTFKTFEEAAALIDPNTTKKINLNQWVGVSGCIYTINETVSLGRVF